MGIQLQNGIREGNDAGRAYPRQGTGTDRLARNRSDVESMGSHSGGKSVIQCVAQVRNDLSCSEFYAFCTQMAVNEPEIDTGIKGFFDL